jgi:hypothetical protein
MLKQYQKREYYNDLDVIKNQENREHYLCFVVLGIVPSKFDGFYKNSRALGCGGVVAKLSLDEGNEESIFLNAYCPTCDKIIRKPFSYQSMFGKNPYFSGADEIIKELQYVGCFHYGNADNMRRQLISTNPYIFSDKIEEFSGRIYPSRPKESIGVLNYVR